MSTFVLVAASLLPITSQAAAPDADSYPSRPVRMIVPFPPGSSDAAARMLIAALSQSTHENFYIENRPGASGTLGATIVAKANPDGYTLLFPTCAHSISAVSYKNLPYDTVKDFDAVARVADSPMVLVVNAKVPGNSAADLIKLSKAQPDKLNFASNGPGSITSLAMYLMERMTDIKLNEIPYKGAGPSLTALMSGEVDIMIAPLGAVTPLMSSGKLKILGIASSHRSPQAPKIPTLAESGIPGFEATCWYGVLAPHGTPKAAIETMNHDIVNAVASPQLRKQFASLGLEPAPSTPKAFDAYIQAEINKWGKVATAGDAPTN